MKKFYRPSLKFILLFNIVIIQVYSRAKCDVRLLETFSLQGLHYSVASPMHICPSVQDRCCTNMDQLRILKLWNSFGGVTTKMHNANLFQTYLGAFRQIEQLIPELDEQNITVTFIKHQWIPYIRHYCGQTTDIETDEDTILQRLIPGDGKIEKWDHVIPKYEYEQKLLDDVDRITTNQYLRIVAHFTRLWEDHFDQMENYYYSEVDLKSIRVRELFTNGVNFQHEKNYFLYFLQIAANFVIDVYQKTQRYYEGKVQEEKQTSYQQTFLGDYKNFMLEAEGFMKAYNNLDCPIKRFTELHIFAQLAKEKIISLLEGLVVRERALYFGIKEKQQFEDKKHADQIKRQRYKDNFKQQKDNSQFNNFISDVRDEYQQFVKENSNKDGHSLNGTTPEQFYTQQYEQLEDKNKMIIPADKLRKLGLKIVKKHLKNYKPYKRSLRRRRGIFRRKKKSKKRNIYKKPTQVPLQDEKIDFPSVALAEIIKFRKKAINYALNVQYKKDLFWKNLIQSFVNTRYDFSPKQAKVTIPGQQRMSHRRRRPRRRRSQYRFDEKQEDFIGKQNRIPNIFFKAWEHTARWQRFSDVKTKFQNLENYHASQVHKPFTLNDRLFQMKAIKMPIPTTIENAMECQVKGRHFYRSLMIQNKGKVEYCYRMIRNLKEEPIDILQEEIKKQINSNLNILDLKKTLYCAVCDPNYQALFHSPKKIIIYEEKFCHNLINMHHEYLTFMHVTLVEFFYKILQTLACLNTTGQVNKLPFDTILDSQMRKVQFIKNCLENSEGEDFMKYCYSVCQQINMLGFSDFWDGNVKVVQEMLVQITQFAQKMNLEPIPEVEQIEYKIPMPVIRDSFNYIHTRGEGFSATEQQLKEAEAGYLKIQQEQAFEINKKETANSQRVNNPKTSSERLPEPKPEDSVLFKELCKKCPSGDDGIQCRVNYCRQPTACERCPEGPDGQYCREKYCEFYQPFMSKYKPANFDTEKEHQPQFVDQDELISLVPKTITKQKRFSKVTSRGLQNESANKIKSESTQVKEGRILAFEDNDQSLRKEIYTKKLPLYDVQSYRNFFTANRSALNPLKLIKGVNFDQISPQELFKKQMNQYKNNSIQPEVVKEFLNIGKKKINQFNKDINIHFSSVLSGSTKHIRKSKKLKAKLKHLRYVKNLKKSTIELELHRPYKYKYKMKKMPPYSFILDDIGTNSNDPISKVMLGKVVRIFKDPKDPRDAVKPYKPKQKSRKKTEMKIAN